MTKILLATWNINSIRARLPALLKWLEINDPDIVMLQELKASDKDIPKEEIENIILFLKDKKHIMVYRYYLNILYLI